MTKSFFISVAFFMSVGSSISTNSLAYAGPFTSASLFVFTGLIIIIPFVNPLLPIILNMIKLFNIRKQVTNINNTTITKTFKDII